jgi:selenide,water dikinase
LLPPVNDPRLLVGADTADDAAVFRLDDKTAIVQTVDYFTPVVDNPYDFGQVAAANALSDIYAMGARPLFALNIVGFPMERFAHSILAEIMRGAIDKCAEAGISIVGGHTVRDDEPKYGLTVTGIVAPDRIVRNSTARAGDALILTKPLGIGIITTGIKASLVSADIIEQATRQMATLNKRASEVMLEVGVNACTDVTGFGLMGHLQEMVSASNVAARVRASRVPIIDEAWRLIENECVPGGTNANRKQADQCTTWHADVAESMRLALCDAQTSGGLLIATPADKAEQMVSSLRDAGIETAAIVGGIEEGPAACLFVDP